MKRKRKLTRVANLTNNKMINKQKGNALVLGIVGVVAVISLVLGGLALNRANKAPEVIVGAAGQQGPQGIPGKDGKDGAQGPRGYTGASGTSVQSSPAPVFGAVSTLDGVDNPYTSIGGLKEFRSRTAMIATSSVVCAYQNPYKATSTPVRFTATVLNNNYLAAQTLYLSTSTSIYASTTPALASFVVPVGGQRSMVWNTGTTTSAVNGTLPGGYFGTNGTYGYSDVLLGPNDVLTLRISTSTPGVYLSSDGTFVGSCSTVIQQL